MTQTYPDFEASLGLEIHDAKTFFDMLIGVSDDKYVDIDTFVKGCMRMKGPATSIDMLSMGYEVTLIHRQNRRVEKAIDELAAWQRKAQPMIDGYLSIDQLHPASPFLMTSDTWASGFRFQTWQAP
eukprot:s1402_g22.t1